MSMSTLEMTGKRRNPMAIEEGKKAPAFTLPDESRNNESLKDVFGNQLVIYIYPKDNTSG